MKAVVYSGYRSTPELTEVEAPACPAGGVVIDVGATGVCRSDWHAWPGHDPVPLPHIPGHELAGAPAALAAVGQPPAAAGMTVIDMTRPDPG